MSIQESSQYLLRPFKPSDLAPVVDLWNRCLPFDPITSDRFWRIFLLDPNFRTEGAIVAELDGQVVGYLQAMSPRSLNGVQHQGYITSFFVDPVRRRVGIGSNLLQAGITYLKLQGCSRVACNGYAPFYAFPGIDHRYGSAAKLMEVSGFVTVSEAVAMEMNLSDYLAPVDIATRNSDLVKNGFAVRLFEMVDTVPLLAFAEEQFPYWKSCLIEDLQAGNHDIVLALHGDKVVGYTQWQNTQTDPPSGAKGRFGPFGVHSELRGQGIGAAIFHTAVEFAIAQGHERLWFGWAGGRNLNFYERAGCKITRRFQLFSRDIS